VSRQDEVLVTRDGPVMTLTFNRPEAHNALTWNMYDRLYETCEEVDRDDSVRVLVLRGAGGKAFVAGTDISQFQAFERAEDGIAYERDGDRSLTLRHFQARNRPLLGEEAQEVLRHLSRLWGFPVRLETVGAGGNVTNTLESTT